MEKKIKIYIIFLIIIIIMILSLILIVYKKLEKENTVDYENNIDEESFEVKIEDNIIEVVDKKEFFDVRDCVQTYIDYMNDKNFTALMTVLDDNYTKKNNITIESLKQHFKENNKNKFIVNKINKKEITLDFIVYYVEGYLADENYSEMEQVQFTILVDSKKELFSIIPEIIYDKDDYNTNIEKDDENYYNKIIYTTYSESKVIKEYFDLYKNLAVKNPQLAYSLMNDEYREKRFGSLESYQKYTIENKDEFENIMLMKYLVNNYEDYIEYVGIDQYGNYYIFKEKAIMDYELLLDTYTINNDVFIKEYQSADEQKKVQMNIDKFIQMVNRHDYISSYNCISEGFKNNYFSTQEEFKNYIQNNFFEYNNFEFKNFEKKGNNVYVYTVQLSDLTEQNQGTKDINIIMRLNDGINFEMSFGM